MKGVEGELGEAVGAAEGVEGEGEGDGIAEVEGFEGALEEVGEEGRFGVKEEDGLELLLTAEEGIEELLEPWEVEEEGVVVGSVTVIREEEV